MKGNRKTYGHVDIGRVEIEGGWYDGESWSFEVHCGYWPIVKRLCIVYLQVGKLCLSVSIRLGDKEEERVGVPVAEAKTEPPKPSATRKGIERFEVGKSYRFIGGREPRGWFSPMQVLRDGKPRKCIKATYEGMAGGYNAPGMAALFEDMPANDGGACWDFSGDSDLFEEVTE